jgi:hypothetical protein
MAILSAVWMIGALCGRAQLAPTLDLLSIVTCRVLAFLVTYHYCMYSYVFNTIQIELVARAMQCGYGSCILLFIPLPPRLPYPPSVITLPGSSQSRRLPLCPHGSSSTTSPSSGV